VTNTFKHRGESGKQKNHNAILRDLVAGEEEELRLFLKFKGIKKRRKISCELLTERRGQKRI